jgi:NAD(P)-dependent dehydrogenase (short-subunit alcohol dehydrogenase family)
VSGSLVKPGTSYYNWQSDSGRRGDGVTGHPLAGQVGIVTGGGKGLGRAFAIDLAAAGASVIVNNRNRQVDADGKGPADHVVAEIRAAGGDAVAEYSDVADPGAAASMLDLALDRYGRIDFLVTSAAISNPEMFHKTTPERFDAVTTINIAGSAHIAAACSAQMRAAGYGRIVLISSTAGLHGEPTASAYSASKGAIIALGRAIAVEGERRNVLTNVVLPYATTQMTDTGMNPSYRDLMTAQVVAPVVTALVDPESTLNAQVLVCGGGGLRATASMEWGTVRLPGSALTPADLGALIETSKLTPAKEYAEAQSAFLDFAQDLAEEPTP